MVDLCLAGGAGVAVGLCQGCACRLQYLTVPGRIRPALLIPHPLAPAGALLIFWQPCCAGRVGRRPSACADPRVNLAPPGSLPPRDSIKTSSIKSLPKREEWPLWPQGVQCPGFSRLRGAAPWRAQGVSPTFRAPGVVCAARVIPQALRLPTPVLVGRPEASAAAIAALTLRY